MKPPATSLALENWEACAWAFLRAGHPVYSIIRNMDMIQRRRPYLRPC